MMLDERDSTPQGPLERAMREKLLRALNPELIDLVNESHEHGRRAHFHDNASTQRTGDAPAVQNRIETHFKLVIVSEAFQGLSRVARSRRVHELLSDELKAGVHALTMRLLVPNEMSDQELSKFVSPNCMGGSQRGGQNG